MGGLESQWELTTDFLIAAFLEHANTNYFQLEVKYIIVYYNLIICYDIEDTSRIQWLKIYQREDGWGDTGAARFDSQEGLFEVVVWVEMEIQDEPALWGAQVEEKHVEDVLFLGEYGQDADEVRRVSLHRIPQQVALVSGNMEAVEYYIRGR